MMIIFLRRLSPWLIAALACLLASWQWQNPLFFPYPLVMVLAVQAAAIGFIGWRRISLGFLVEKMFPSLLAEAVMGGAFLLTENSLERWIVTGLFVGIPLLSLELFFLLVYDPSRYPVNGLSRLNLALLPVASFFLASTVSGLQVFLVDSLHLPEWVWPVIFVLFGSVFYLLTAHPSAERAHRERWAWIGALVGLQVGLLGLLMPVGMAVHGAVAALIFSFPLRMRRYAYQPVPPPQLAWAEGVLAIGLFCALLFSSRWA